MIYFDSKRYKCFVKSAPRASSLNCILAKMKILQILAPLLFGLISYAQQPLISGRLDTFETVADRYVGFDNFGFYYFITNDVFIKSGIRGTVEYKNVSLGKITRADIQNPLLIVLFYEQFNTIVLLDNQLNEIRRIDFGDHEDQLIVRAAGLASQNRLWLFDTLRQQIVLYDYQQDEFRPIGTQIMEIISDYYTDFNYFRWIDSKNDSYQMDVFGKILKIGKVPPYKQIAFAESDGWLVSDGTKMWYADAAKNALIELPDVGNSVKNFYLKDQILSIFTSHGITNYKFKKP